MAAREYTAKHKREFAPKWYPWQMESFVCSAPQIMTLAANRCIGPSTQIETPRGLVPVEELISETGFDVVSWDGESRCVRAASPVFLKGIEPMFRFHTDTGFFDCSRKHQVLTQSGYLSASRLVWLLSGRRWMEIYADCEASYDEHESRYGQLLHLAAGNGLIPLPSITDAQALGLLAELHRGEAARNARYNRTWQEFCHPSIEDDSALIAALCEKWRDSRACSDAPPNIEIPLIDGPQRLASNTRPLSGERGQISVFEFSQASDFLVASNNIVSIEYIGFQPVLDFTVEETSCYFAAGVIHHNSGKTISAGYHTACDLSGDYPDWWDGPRFGHGVNCLVMGVDNQQLRDVVQTELFGEVIEEGNKRRLSGGWVHTDEIGRIEWSPYGSGLARRVEVLGKLGMSNCTLRAYSQSRTGTKTLSFAGTSIDLIWVDECPPDELVGQLVTRTMTGNYGKGGRIRYTMTPELGATRLVTQFMEDAEDSQHLVGPVSWGECPHLSEEVQKSILAGIPAHEHDMRSKGVPFFGSGLVYPIAEDRIKVEPITIPPHWTVIRAIDLGIHHPTAICWLAYNRDEDTIYLVKTYSVKGENAATHAQALNTLWKHAKVVFPHDVDTTEKGSGKTVRSYYRDAGIKNTVDFKNPDKSISVEPGIFDITERMRDGRFKVFSTCTEFWREYRLYHRDEGKLVKENDDVMDAMRYGSVMIPRYGMPAAGKRRTPKVRTGLSLRMGRK